MFNHVLSAWLQAQVPGVPEHRIANIFKPLATPADSERTAAYLVLAIAAGIFLVVAGLLVYTILRFRRRPGESELQEPPQVYGSNQIEAAWTVIPILIVFVLIGVSARVIAAIENASPPPQMLKIELIGHQWWWEVRYPAYGLVTANEIHVPVSTDGKRATYLELTSVDVIHSFWVPQLAGKTDLIPNHPNDIWIQPEHTGLYVGQCAQFCGVEHAKMLLRVIVDSPADFAAWTQQQQQPGVQDPSVAAGRHIFETEACTNCHVIAGTPAIGTFGPDLTHLMSRSTIASGAALNTPENLRAWIQDPNNVKPGALMPAMQLTDPQIDQVVAYLRTLH